jgi:cytidine deaminase
MSYQDLIKAALSARECAYAPYARIRVGATLLTKSGKIFGACNVENGCLGVTFCPERCVVAAVVADGDREFTVIAVVTGFPGRYFHVACAAKC